MTPIHDPPLAEWLAENCIYGVDPTSSRFTGLRDRIKQFAAEQRVMAESEARADERRRCATLARFQAGHDDGNVQWVAKAIAEAIERGDPA